MVLYIYGFILHGSFDYFKYCNSKINFSRPLLLFCRIKKQIKLLRTIMNLANERIYCKLLH